MLAKLLSDAKMFISGVVTLAAVAVALCAPKTKVPHPRPNGKIIGGDDANIEDYPYQLSLLYKGEHICGAAIIDKRWAITAAHCTDGLPTSRFTVRAGSSLLEHGGQVVKVKNVHQHPGYVQSDLDFDISVLELEEDIVFGKTASPIELVQANARIVPGSEAVVTGWGVLHQDDTVLPTHLQVVTVPVISNDECSEAYSSEQITDRMICAGFAEGGKDACQGDSGGPFVVDGKLAGVVSWGYGCANPDLPGVYTNLVTLRDFVKDISKI